jgi:hypothetical protein
MPFSFFRIPGFLRCPMDPVRLVARGKIEGVLARGEA